MDGAEWVDADASPPAMAHDYDPERGADKYAIGETAAGVFGRPPTRSRPAPEDRGWPDRAPAAPPRAAPPRTAPPRRRPAPTASRLSERWPAPPGRRPEDFLLDESWLDEIEPDDAWSDEPGPDEAWAD